MWKRYQKGTVKPVGGKWIAQWREHGCKKKRTLGCVGKMTKSEAGKLLAEIVAPINARTSGATPEMTFGLFVSSVYLPFYHRKWKGSTRGTNDDRIGRYLVSEFKPRKLGTFRRDELQDYLDRRADQGLAYSTVAHLRWDLRQIFRMAVSEDFIVKNPAELLFVPQKCPRANTPVMNLDQVALLFHALEVREALIAKLAVIAGMRPGEIFALKWGHLGTDHADVQQRVYRGKIDTPKSHQSFRRAALAEGLRQSIEEWRLASGNPEPDEWIFPSEKGTTPLAKDNCWRRWFQPRLKMVGLEWVNFQIMRKTHSCIGADLEIDPQVRADQMGHTVDVNQNVYTRSSLDRRIAAVNTIEKAVVM